MSIPRQYGGLDPATSALIASLAVGGISAYGAQAVEKNKEALLDERSGGIINQLKEIGIRLTSERDEAREEIEKLKTELQKKQFEINAAKQELGQSSESIQRLKEGTGPALVFKNATTETLKRAVERTVTKLGEFATGKPGYEWLQDPKKLPNTIEALGYPTTYQGKLARMSLPAFYEKRLKKAAQLDFDKTKGGKKRRRRRARRGGDAAGTGTSAVEQAQEGVQTANEAISGFSASPPATVTETPPRTRVPLLLPPPAFPFPTYEEFAKLYSDAINEVSLTGVQEIRKKSEEYRKQVLGEKSEKENKAAIKAARLLADKLQKVVKNAESELSKYVNMEASVKSEDILEKRKKLDDDIADANIRSRPPNVIRKDTGETYPHFYSTDPTEDRKVYETYTEEVDPKSLYSVKTKEEWDNPDMKGAAMKLLTDIPKEVKEYVNALKKEAKTSVATPAETTEAGPALEKPSDSIHQEILKTTPLSIKELKDRIKQFQKAWDNAKSARESFCKPTKDISIYKGGPEAYERISEVMGKADDELFSMKKLLRLLTTFLDDYKNETEGIAFVGNESFKTTTPPPPAAEEEGQFGGAFQALIDLRSKFTQYQEDLAKSKVTTASIEEKLKKVIEKLKAIRAKGPMTPEERVEEEKERKRGEEFRLTPLITECYPYGVPPSAETEIKPPPTVPPASTSIQPEVLESLSTYKDLGTGTGLPSVEKEEEGDFPTLTIKPPPTEPTTPAELVTNKAIGFQKVPGKLRQSPPTKLFRKFTRRKTPLSSVGQGRSRKRTLKKRRAGK